MKKSNTLSSLALPDFSTKLLSMMQPLGGFISLPFPSFTKNLWVILLLTTMSVSEGDFALL